MVAVSLIDMGKLLQGGFRLIRTPFASKLSYLAFFDQFRSNLAGSH
jgi:hypothetical protein